MRISRIAAFFIAMSAFALGLSASYLAPTYLTKLAIWDIQTLDAEQTAEAKNFNTKQDTIPAPTPIPATSMAPQQAVANATLPPPNLTNPEERYDQLRELPPEAFPVLMAELCSDIGPEGLNFQEQNLIQNGLRKWWKSNRETLLQWVASQPNSATKRYLMSKILEDFLLKEDPERAKTLAEAYRLQDPKWAAEYNNLMVSGPIEAAWKNPQTTADQMLALYKRVNRGRHTQGTGVEVYPEGFDFRKFLDGMDAMDEADGLKSSIMPSDTLAAWAKQDPQQAAQWLLQAQAKWKQQGRSSLPFADWQEIAKVVAGNSGPQTYYEWAAEFVGDLDEDSRRSVLSAYGREGDVLGILSATKDTGTRDKILASAISGGDAEQTLSYLKMLSTPEARLAAIKSNKWRLNDLTKDFEVDAATYRQLGLTEGQVKEALAKDE
jgi:hypothetical protein